MATLWNRGFTLTWLGHSAFELVTKTGKVVLFDPFLESNPKCPADRKHPAKADIIALSHAHGDHASEVPAIAERTGATVVCGYEAYVHLESKGVKNCKPMGVGGTQLLHGIGFTMTNAIHSSSFDEPGRPNGGIASGFVVTLEDGTRLYYAGDTGPTMDMQLVRELYEPVIAILPIGDLFTMGPREAAWAAEKLGVLYVVPMHWGTFDMLTGTPTKLREALTDRGYAADVVDMVPGVPQS